MVTQRDIARRARLDVSSVNKILNGRHNGHFGKKTEARVLQIAKNLGFDFQRLKYFHRRKAERIRTDMAATFTIYAQGTDQVRGKGTCRIVDLSLSGAALGVIALSRGTVPLGPYSIRLRMRIAVARARDYQAHFVRTSLLGETPCIGVRFAPDSQPRELIAVLGGMTRHRSDS